MSILRVINCVFLLFKGITAQNQGFSSNIALDDPNLPIGRPQLPPGQKAFPSSHIVNCDHYFQDNKTGLPSDKRIDNVRSCREQKIISELMYNYSSAVRPLGPNPISNLEKNETATLVDVTVRVVSLSSFNDVTMEFIGQIIFQQEWYDSRVRFDPHHDSSDGYHEQSWLALGNDQKLWIPDTFFHNEQEGHSHSVDKLNQVIRIRYDGHVQYHKRLTMAFACPMNLELFPHDDQECVIDFGSYAYTSADITYRWINTTLDQSADSNLPKFKLASCQMRNCDSNTATGKYSCLRIRLKLHREFSFFFMTLYIPSCMLVSVSFVSFWIDWRSAPSRVPLTIVTLLTVTTQSHGINASLPPVSYIKAIDLWIGACTIFVFGALIEFAIVNYVGTQEQLRMQSGNIGNMHHLWDNELGHERLVFNDSTYPSEAPDELKHLLVSSPVPRRHHHRPPFRQAVSPMQLMPPSPLHHESAPPPYRQFENQNNTLNNQPINTIVNNQSISLNNSTNQSISLTGSQFRQHETNIDMADMLNSSSNSKQLEGIMKRNLTTTTNDNNGYSNNADTNFAVNATIATGSSVRKRAAPFLTAPHKQPTQDDLAVPPPPARQTIIVATQPRRIPIPNPFHVISQFFAQREPKNEFKPNCVDNNDDRGSFMMDRSPNFLRRFAGRNQSNNPNTDLVFNNPNTNSWKEPEANNYPESSFVDTVIPSILNKLQITQPSVNEVDDYRNRLHTDRDWELPPSTTVSNKFGDNLRRRRRGRFILFDKQTTRAERIDQIARIVFPIGFVLFNVAYWVTYYQTTDLSDGCVFDNTTIEA